MALTAVRDEQLSLGDIDQTVKMKNATTLRLEADPPQLQIRDTGFGVDTGGLWRVFVDSATFEIQRNTALAGNFSTTSASITIGAADNVTLKGVLTLSLNDAPRIHFSGVNSAASAGVNQLFRDSTDLRLHFKDDAAADKIFGYTVDAVNHRISSATPAFELRDTDQALPNGLWRIRQDELKVRIERNTAAGGDFSTDQDHMNIINNPTGNEVAVEIFGTMTLFSLGTAGSPAVRFEDAVTAVNATPKSIYRNSVDSRPHWTTTAHVFPGGPADERVIAFHEDMVVRETPSGAVDGVNVTFTLAFTPVTGKEQVYLNGILQDAGATNDYTISGVTITYNTAPVSGDKLRVSYIYKS